MRSAKGAELEAWDELVSAAPGGGNILQTRAWGEFKREEFWQPHYLIADTAAGANAQLWLSRNVPGIGQIYYCPKGPGISAVSELPDYDPINFPQAIALKIEPEFLDSPETTSRLAARGYLKVPDVQIHRATMIVDITPDEAALLAGFKSKTRYNIRLAEKKGVKIESVPCTEENCDIFFALYAETAHRANFALRPKRYYTRYWRLFAAAGQGQLFLARHDGAVIAGLYVTVLGKKAWYKDGGSASSGRELMAPHLLQWETMRWLKQHGVAKYDLVAVPPRDSLHEGHPLYGLWRFKSGFCDEITEFVGTWDLPVSRRRYALWRKVGEPLSARIAWRLNRDLFY